MFAHEPPRRQGQAPRLALGGRSLLEAVEWRNRTIGHGSASHDIDDVRRTVLDQQSRLFECLEQLDFLRETHLQSTTSNGEVVEWNTRVLPTLKIPVDTPDVQSVPCPTSLLREKTSLDLGPLLLMGTQDRSASLLTFDKASNGYFYLDHYTGKKKRFEHVAGMKELAARYPRYIKQRRLAEIGRGGVLAHSAQAYSGDALQALEAIEFGSDMQASFVKQTHIYEAFEKVLAAFDKGEGRGFFHLVGGAGTGKSWFITSVTQPKVHSYSAEVLCYHIRMGMRQNPELFIEALHNQVQEPSGHNVHGARIRLEEGVRPSEAVALFLDRVLQTSRQRRILLTVDGLDELLEPTGQDTAATATILDYIPLPDELPSNVVVVLSSRPDSELRKRTRQFVEGLRAHPDLYVRYDLAENLKGQQANFRTYLTKRLNVTSEQLLTQILSLCEGSFLRATLLGKLCSLAGKVDWPDMPSEVGDLYDLYLNHKASQIGKELFDSLHCRVLYLLSVSAIPLSLSRIADFTGVQEERVLFTLFDIGEFFAVKREHRDNSFSIAHALLTDYLLASHAKEISLLLKDVVADLFDDTSVEEWLVETSETLRKIGQTQLCTDLCDMLLARMLPGSLRRVQVLRIHIDMVHIRGQYTVAATYLGELGRESVEVQGRHPNDPEVVSTRMRQAHHLKFVAPVGVARGILADLLDQLPSSNAARREIRFDDGGFYWLSR